MIAMIKMRSKFYVHAELMGSSSASADFDDVKAGRPIERRLNRMERVVAAYRGQIEKRLNNGLQLTFESADAALLGACEMQHRCAVLPQVSANRLALRIGIHQGIVRQRSKDGADDTREIASQLATIDDDIVASDIVVAELNPELRKLTRLINDTPAGIAAYKVDWRNEIPSVAFGGESSWPSSKGPRPPGAYLLLHNGLKTLELTQDNPLLTVGRDPINDLVLVADHISRNHCRFERRIDCILLTDSSTNGTCVTPDKGEEVLVKNSSFVLKGKGLLFFGRLCNGERRGGTRYEAR
jgi:pSer/pThr/pTyr-binding forkhead associated (FHA) protein